MNGSAPTRPGRPSGLWPWFGWPPSPQAIPIGAAVGYGLAWILQKGIGFDRFPALADWLNLASALAFAWPALELARQLYRREQSKKVAGALSGGAGEPAQDLGKAVQADADRDRQAGVDWSRGAILWLYFGYLLLIAAAVGSIRWPAS